MPKYITIFETKVDVPQWEYCNEQKERTSKSSNYCNFMVGNKDERNCRLFNKMLYSAYEWVKKCDECLVKSEIGEKEYQ